MSRVMPSMRSRNLLPILEPSSLSGACVRVRPASAEARERPPSAVRRAFAKSHSADHTSDFAGV